MYKVFPSTVVVGLGKSLENLYAALKPKALAVPSSLILIINMSLFTGVPVGAPNVAAPAKAVTSYSVLFVDLAGVGVELDVIEV